MRELDPVAAASHLRAADPVMARLIDEHGPVAMREPGATPLFALARAITYQQLSGKAAGTIFGRFVAAVTAGEHPFEAPRILAMGEEELRGCGLSRQKSAALRSLSEFAVDGGLSGLDGLGDEVIIERLVQVRGVGRWSAQMFLMFDLRRPDVLPTADLGVNRAIMTLYGLPAMPKPPEVERIGAPWRPHATVACWYLWRSGDSRPPG